MPPLWARRVNGANLEFERLGLPKVAKRLEFERLGLPKVAKRLEFERLAQPKSRTERQRAERRDGAKREVAQRSCDGRVDDSVLLYDASVF